MPKLEQALERLRQGGYKITNARQVVLEVLAESETHLSSTRILEMVGERDPGIGRASVFRTLELLTRLAVVRPTYLEPRTPVYVMMSGEGHHAHIICTDCHQIIELPECHVDDLIHQLEIQHGLRVTGHLLEFYGVCESCEHPRETS